MRAAAAGLLGLLLAACAASPPTPDWQVQTQAAMQRAPSAYLVGDSRVAALEFERARTAVARTGRADLLARVELLHCAARVASLEAADCPAFEALRGDAGAAERAYADWLGGRVLPSDVALLPAPQRVLAARIAGARATGVDTAAASVTAADLPAADESALRGITKPLSRLVAAGVLFNAARAGPGVAAVAVETASEQGWRRPLLAWLQLQQQHAAAAGERDAVERLRRRIARVLDPVLTGATR